MERKLKKVFSPFLALLMIFFTYSPIFSEVYAAGGISTGYNSTPPKGSVTYTKTGTSVAPFYVITATPTKGYKFVNWTISGINYMELDNNNDFVATNPGSSTRNPLKLFSTNLGATINVTANFEDLNLTVTKQPNNGGTVGITKIPKINAVGQYTGLQYMLAATPADGYRFKEWKHVSGDATLLSSPTVSSALFDMHTEDSGYQAVFEAINYDIEVTTNGHGNANADKTKATVGEDVGLTATANEGYHFSYWKVTSGGIQVDNITSDHTNFEMGTQNVAIQAVFEQDQQSQDPQPATYFAAITNDGNGTAVASVNPDLGESDSDTALSNLSEDDIVYLKAIANSGYQFKRWVITSGNVTELTNATSPTGASFKMGANNVIVRATFEPIPNPKYSVVVENDGHGTASAEPNSEVSQDQTVNLSATAYEGYQFDHWEAISEGISLNNATDANTTFRMGSSDAKVRAVFEEIPTVTTYGVVVNSSGGGTAGANPKENLNTDDTVTLSATANPGYRFDHWEVVSGGVELSDATKADATFTIGSENVILNAIFEEIPTVTTYTVNTQSGGNGTASADPSSNVATGTTVQLTATPDSGYKFKNWEVVSGGVELSDATKADATFIMGSENVVVQANFEKETTPSDPDNPTDPDNPNNQIDSIDNYSASGPSASGGNTSETSKATNDDTTDDKGEKLDTGDPRSFTIWWLFMIVSLIGLGFSFFPRKKGKEIS